MLRRSPLLHKGAEDGAPILDVGGVVVVLLEAEDTTLKALWCPPVDVVEAQYWLLFFYMHSHTSLCHVLVKLLLWLNGALVFAGIREWCAVIVSISSFST